MADCKKCEYSGRATYDWPCSTCHNGSKFEANTPPTNADRIRAMSDEELAKEIAWLVVEAFDQVVPGWGWKIDRDNRIAGTAKDMLDWLQSLAGGDGK